MMNINEIINVISIINHCQCLFFFFFKSLVTVLKPQRWTYLSGLQVLSILHPPVRGFGFPCGLAFPHQRVIYGLLHILGLLN